jgi:hypothetical protein
VDGRICTGIGPAELILEPNMQSRHHMQPVSPSCFILLLNAITRNLTDSSKSVQRVSIPPWHQYFHVPRYAHSSGGLNSGWPSGNVKVGASVSGEV